MSTDRQLWMAWSDEGEGWIAAIHGTSEKRADIQWRIDQDTKKRKGNRFGTRPVLVTVHLQDDVSGNDGR